MNTTSDDLDLVARIAVDADVCFGRPYIRRHKVLVSLVLGFLASGSTVADVMGEFPILDEADVLACLAYAERRRTGVAGPKAVAA